MGPYYLGVIFSFFDRFFYKLLDYKKQEFFFQKLPRKFKYFFYCHESLEKLLNFSFSHF